MAGWIKLHRQIKSHWLWQDATKLKWWIDILLEANHEEKQVMIKGTIMTCGRGQCVRSEQSWATIWGVDRSTVRRFFSALKTDGICNIETTSKTTILTVCKYDSYQTERPARATAHATANTTTEATTDAHKQEGKEDKKGKKKEDISALPVGERFESFWNSYGKKEDLDKCEAKWLKMSSEERIAAIAAAGKYAARTPDKKYRKNPHTWLNGKNWKDETLNESADQPSAGMVKYRSTESGAYGEMEIALWMARHEGNPGSLLKRVSK